jgi:flagellar hook-basal body protein
MSKTNDVSAFTKSTNTQGTNLSGAKTPGFKKRENIFVNSFVGSSKGGVSYLKSTTRQNISEQGAISTSSSDSHLAIEGAGMMLVSRTATSEAVYTRSGDFNKDRNGYWKNGGGYLLRAWKLDSDGKLPSNSTLLSSLEVVNFANIKGTPKATSVVSLAMNLDGREETEAIRGAGFTAKLNTSGLNVNTKPDAIIMPENLPKSGGIKLGDQFTFNSTPPDEPKNVVYGGVAVSNLASNTLKIFGAGSSVEPFLEAGQGAADPNRIVAGSILDINGQYFYFKQANPRPENKEFNSFTSLAAALNKTGDFVANLDNKGRLYIAPKNPNEALTFQGLNGGENIPTTLGLFNVAAKPLNQNYNRFYSLDTLKKAVNRETDASLKATIENGSIKITSKLATSNFTLDGTSMGVRNFTTVTVGGDDVAGLNRARTVIHSPAHGLTTGDLVRIKGVGGNTGDGIYAVGKVLGNNDQFEIFPFLGGAALNGVAALPANTTAADGRTWQRVPGQKFADVTIQPAGANAANGGPVTITSNGHDLVNNDIIYISGFGNKHVTNQDVQVPDGYYSITAANANSFTIVPAATANHPGGGGFPALPAAGFTYQKVGNGVAVAAGNASTALGAANAAKLNSNVMVTTLGANGLGPASNRVKLFTTDSTYSVGDYISFNDLPVGPPAFSVDSIAVQNNTRYKIVDTSAANTLPSFVTFEVEGGIATNGDEGATSRLDIKSYVAADVGSDFQVNNISQTLKYLGVERPRDQENDLDLQQTYTAVYNPDDPKKNLKALLDNSTSTDNNTFITEADVYDSLGDMFTLQFRFAKLDQGKWAYSASLKADAEGNFSDPSYAANAGQISYGEITFDGNGKFMGTSSNPTLNINRDNGSSQSDIIIDWENLLNDQTSAMITQYGNPNNPEPYQQNGRSSGNLLDNGLSVNDEGFIIGTFDNGDVLRLYQIPLATFANVDGLLASDNGTYRITGDSGKAYLKAAGKGGAGQIIGRALEDSNVNTTDQLLEVQETSNDIRAAARVASVELNNVSTILNELKN